MSQAEWEDDDVPNFLAFSVASDNPINDGRLPRFRVRVILTNGVHLDILHVVHIYELLVDIGAFGARVTEV